MATNALLYSLQLSPSIVRVVKYQKAVVIGGNISAHFDAPIGANSGSRKPRIGFTPDIDGCAGLAGERVNPAIINLCERRPAHPIRVPFDTAVKSRGGFVGPIFLHRHYQLSLFPIGRHHGDQCPTLYLLHLESQAPDIRHARQLYWLLLARSCISIEHNMLARLGQTR